MTPLTLRREKAREVFDLFIKYLKYAKRKEKKEGKKEKGGKKIIRRPASDTWF